MTKWKESSIRSLADDRWDLAGPAVFKPEICYLF